ncbi:MAG: phosphatase PAP2 family protein [Rhodothermales bacterium]
MPTPTLLIVLFALSSAFVRTAGAQGADDPLRFGRWLVQDVRGAVPAVVRTSPVRLGAVAGVIITTSIWDSRLSREARVFDDSEPLKAVEEFGDADAMRPLALVIFVGSLFQDNPRVQDAAFTSLEALALANVATNALKLGFGRARPWQTGAANVFDPFSGNTSFPSGHATTVFAGLMPWVYYFPGPSTYVLAGLGLSTAFSRVALRHHWPSDVIGGAFMGSAVSYWLYRQHTRDAADGTFGSTRVTPVLGARTVGLMVTF